jgi:hypothetical protein
MSAVRRQPLFVLLALGALTCLPLHARPAATPTFEKILQQCQRDPAYRVGGAAIGECLEVAAAQRDDAIATQLQALAQDHCATVGAAMKQSQQRWQE